MTIRTTVAAPFKHTRKNGMRKNELVYYYALDRKWMSTEQANSFLQRAEEDGLLKLENGVYTILFDPATVTIPIGFKPSSAIFERNDPAQEMISQIARARKMDETDVVAEMNRLIREHFDGCLLPPAALVLLSQKYKIPFESYLEPLTESVIKNR